MSTSVISGSAWAPPERSFAPCADWATRWSQTAVAVSDMTPTDGGDFEAFAAAVAHEIRTPLTAVAGEIEVALRRERSATDYREALVRIAAGVAELVEISADLTLLGDVPGDAAQSLHAALDSILSSVRHRYRGRDDVSIDAVLPAGLRIVGNEARLA